MKPRYNVSFHSNDIHQYVCKWWKKSVCTFCSNACMLFLCDGTTYKANVGLLYWVVYTEWRDQDLGRDQEWNCQPLEIKLLMKRNLSFISLFSLTETRIIILSLSDITLSRKGTNHWVIHVGGVTNHGLCQWCLHHVHHAFLRI